jgi:hypothetical protein
MPRYHYDSNIEDEKMDRIYLEIGIEVKFVEKPMISTSLNTSFSKLGISHGKIGLSPSKLGISPRKEGLSPNKLGSSPRRSF